MPGSTTKPPHRKMDILVLEFTDTAIRDRFYNFRRIKVGDNFSIYTNIGYVFSCVTPDYRNRRWWNALCKASQDKTIHWLA